MWNEIEWRVNANTNTRKTISNNNSTNNNTPKPYQSHTKNHINTNTNIKLFFVRHLSLRIMFVSSVAAPKLKLHHSRGRFSYIFSLTSTSQFPDIYCSLEVYAVCCARALECNYICAILCRSGH